MLEKEFQYYLDNQEDLVKKYSGKYIVIVKDKVVGVHDSDASAYIESVKKFNEGDFLIQFCTEGEESYSQTFHSQVSFG